MTCYITLIGNSGSDAEMKSTGSKVPYVRFSVASNKGKDETDWYSVNAYGDLISYAQKLTKGSKVTVTGRLTTSQGKDGKTYLNVRASDLSYYSKQEQQQLPQATSYSVPQHMNTSAGDFDSEETPF